MDYSEWISSFPFSGLSCQRRLEWSRLITTSHCLVYSSEHSLPLAEYHRVRIEHSPWQVNHRKVGPARPGAACEPIKSIKQLAYFYSADENHDSFELAAIVAWSLLDHNRTLDASSRTIARARSDKRY